MLSSKRAWFPLRKKLVVLETFVETLTGWAAARPLRQATVCQWFPVQCEKCPNSGNLAGNLVFKIHLRWAHMTDEQRSFYRGKTRLKRALGMTRKALPKPVSTGIVVLPVET